MEGGGVLRDGVYGRMECMDGGDVWRDVVNEGM